jgi:hypothetical protein
VNKENIKFAACFIAREGMNYVLGLLGGLGVARAFECFL